MHLLLEIEKKESKTVIFVVYYINFMIDMILMINFKLIIIKR